MWSPARSGAALGAPRQFVLVLSAIGVIAYLSSCAGGRSSEGRLTRCSRHGAGAFPPPVGKHRHPPGPVGAVHDGCPLPRPAPEPPHPARPSGREANPYTYAAGDPVNRTVPAGTLSLDIGGEACSWMCLNGGVNTNEDGGPHGYPGVGLGTPGAGVNGGLASGSAEQGWTGEIACGIGPAGLSVATDDPAGVGTGRLPRRRARQPSRPVPVLLSAGSRPYAGTRGFGGGRFARHRGHRHRQSSVAVQSAAGGLFCGQASPTKSRDRVAGLSCTTETALL